MLKFLIFISFISPHILFSQAFKSENNQDKFVEECFDSIIVFNSRCAEEILSKLNKQEISGLGNLDALPLLYTDFSTYKDSENYLTVVEDLLTSLGRSDLIKSLNLKYELDHSLTEDFASLSPEAKQQHINNFEKVLNENKDKSNLIIISLLKKVKDISVLTADFKGLFEGLSNIDYPIISHLKSLQNLSPEMISFVNKFSNPQCTYLSLAKVDSGQLKNINESIEYSIFQFDKKQDKQLLEYLITNFKQKEDFLNYKFQALQLVSNFEDFEDCDSYDPEQGLAYIDELLSIEESNLRNLIQSNYCENKNISKTDFSELSKWCEAESSDEYSNSKTTSISKKEIDINIYNQLIIYKDTSIIFSKFNKKECSMDNERFEFLLKQEFPEYPVIKSIKSKKTEINFQITNARKVCFQIKILPNPFNQNHQFDFNFLLEELKRNINY